MIIPINLPSTSLSNPETSKFPPQLAKLASDEVVLIELQGAFEVEGDAGGQVAAKLRFGENESKPTMLIGHNLLEGKIVNLTKPLAVLKKKNLSPLTDPAATMSQSRRQNRNQDGEDAMDELEDELDGDGEGDARRETKEAACVEYDMLAVVKRKLLFSKRPMPVVNMVQTARTLPGKSSTL